MYRAEDYDGYFLWLCSLVNADMTRYSELLWTLHEMDFVWILELDESRSVDGLDLRREYFELCPDEDWIIVLEKGCSVLEMLIALARRIEGVLGDINTGDRTRVWFWEMLRNLGLKPYSNIRLEYDEDGSELMDVQLILSKWMNREFDIDGTGSIFPLMNPVHNQLERSIVYQMYDYLIENYPDE